MKKLQSPETQSLLIILLVLTSLCALSCETSVEDPDPPDFELEILNRYGVIRIPENTNVRFYNNTDTPKTVYLEIRNPYGFFVGNTAAETVIAHPFSSVMLSYSLSDESLVNAALNWEASVWDDTENELITSRNFQVAIPLQLEYDWAEGYDLWGDYSIRQQIKDVFRKVVCDTQMAFTADAVITEPLANEVTTMADALYWANVTQSDSGLDYHLISLANWPLVDYCSPAATGLTIYFPYSGFSAVFQDRLPGDEYALDYLVPFTACHELGHLVFSLEHPFNDGMGGNADLHNLNFHIMDNHNNTNSGSICVMDYLSSTNLYDLFNPFEFCFNGVELSEDLPTGYNDYSHSDPDSSSCWDNIWYWITTGYPH